MPRKKTTPTTQEERIEVVHEPQTTPILPGVTVPRNYTPYYVLLLIIFAFLLGALTTKIQALQGGTGSTAPAPTQAAAAQAQQPQGPAAHVNVANGHFPVTGQDSAKVTIVEFADPRCPFCKQFHDTVLPQIKTDYIDTGKVKMYFRNYDFLGPSSTVAGNALECANEQGHFWDLEAYFYTNQPDESDTSLFTTDKLSALAGTLGMNTDQFSTCLNANPLDSKGNQGASSGVATDLSDGQKVGVSGTPTFFINGNSLVGAQPYSAFKTIIDQELAKN